MKKTIDVWFVQNGKGEVQITLPVHNLEDELRISRFDVSKDIKVSKVSELIEQFNYSDIQSAKDLNKLLTYINSTVEPLDTWTLFNALQEVFALDTLDTYTLLISDDFELFMEAFDMEELARYLVKENRLFTRKVYAELLNYLDYEAIANNLLTNAKFYQTTYGILWSKS